MNLQETGYRMKIAMKELIAMFSPSYAVILVLAPLPGNEQQNSMISTNIRDPVLFKKVMEDATERSSSAKATNVHG